MNILVHNSGIRQCLKTLCIKNSTSQKELLGTRKVSAIVKIADSYMPDQNIQRSQKS